MVSVDRLCDYRFKDRLIYHIGKGEPAHVDDKWGVGDLFFFCRRSHSIIDILRISKLERGMIDHAFFVTSTSLSR